MAAKTSSGERKTGDANEDAAEPYGDLYQRVNCQLTEEAV